MSGRKIFFDFLSFSLSHVPTSVQRYNYFFSFSHFCAIICGFLEKMTTFAPVKQHFSCLILLLAAVLPVRGGGPAGSLAAGLLQFGLPVVEVITVDDEEPTYEEADAPEGCLGGSIRNAVKVPGRILICDTTGVIYDSGPYEKAVSGMTVKVRGNWSARRPKKPFKVKLQRAANLLIPAARGRADRDWLLMPYFDLNSMIGFKVGELMGLPWTPQFRFVHLVFNDNYRGLYLLMESVDRHPARLDVADSGFITELDAYWWNEDAYVPAHFEEPLNYTFKYPDGNDLTDGRLDSIAAVLTAAEASLYDGTYARHLDVASFARWMLTHDILGNRDGAGSNMFISKYDDSDTTLLRMDCLWDLDVIMESEGWDELHSRYFFGAMFRSPDRTFADAYAALWADCRDRVTDGILQFLDDYMASPLRQAVDTAIVMNNHRWAREMYELPPSAPAVAAARSWFLARRPWLDDAILTLTAISHSCVPSVASDQRSSASSLISHSSSLIPHWFDLHGRRLSAPPRHGIYIENGKKRIR